MAIWLMRAGFHGEYEQKSLQESRVNVRWDKLAEFIFNFARKAAGQQGVKS